MTVAVCSVGTRCVSWFLFILFSPFHTLTVHTKHFNKFLTYNFTINWDDIETVSRNESVIVSVQLLWTCTRTWWWPHWAETCSSKENCELWGCESDWQEQTSDSRNQRFGLEHRLTGFKFHSRHHICMFEGTKLKYTKTEPPVMAWCLY
jgi:hypothetical protein